MSEYAYDRTTFAAVPSGQPVDLASLDDQIRAASWSETYSHLEVEAAQTFTFIFSGLLPGGEVTALSNLVAGFSGVGTSSVDHKPLVVTGTVDPGASNGANEGYLTGTIFLNTQTERCFVLANAQTPTWLLLPQNLSDFDLNGDPLGQYQLRSESGQAGGYATLDVSGKVPISQIHATAIPSFHVVANAAARAALTVQEGDESLQLDDGSFWIFDGAAWVSRPGGTGDVIGPSSSVDGRIVTFDGTTGKLIQQGNLTESSITSAQADATQAISDAAAVQSNLTSHIGTGGSAHALATASTAGFLSPAGFTALQNFGVYGTELNKVSDMSVTTTTSSNTAVEKLRLPASGTLTLPSGDYELLVTYGWNLDSTSRDFLSRVHHNGSQIGQYHQQEPKESGGSFESTGADQKVPVTRVLPLTISAGTHYFQLFFRTQQNGVEASMWDAYMRIVRVA